MTIHSAKTTVTLARPADVLKELLHHLKEHDLTAERDADGAYLIRLEPDSHVRIGLTRETLAFEVCAPSRGKLYRFKEGVVDHLEEIVPQATADLRWSGDDETTSDNSAMPTNFRRLALQRKSLPFDGMQRLTFSYENAESDLGCDGIHVKLLLPPDAAHPPVWPGVAANGKTLWPEGSQSLHTRYYTLRHVRPEDGEIDIDIVLHSHGKIVQWAQQAERGDILGLMGPGGGESVPPDARNILLAADETALPALARMLEGLPPRCSGHALVALPKEARDYLPKTQIRLIHLTSQEFPEKVAELARQCAQVAVPDFCWAAGEFDTAQEMRKLFKNEFALPKGRQYAITYWRRGQEGDAGSPRARSQKIPPTTS